MAIPNESILSVEKDSAALLFLRVLTPQLVKKITRSTGSNGRIQLVDMLFSNKVEEVVEKIEVKAITVNPVEEKIATVLPLITNIIAENSVEVNPVEKRGLFSKSKLEEMELEKQRLEDESRPSATVFLLEEKRKLKLAQEKIKKKEVLDMYSNTAKTNVKESKNKNLTIAEDGEVFVESSSYKGGLINKRQY